MNRKVKWGLGAFIILIIVVAAVILIRDQAKLRQMEADLEAAKQKVEELNSKKQEQPIADNGPPPAEPGFKWVRHGDHWDKVPIAEPHQHNPQEVPVTTYDGPLTYHEELLETHPVEALYQQTLERGHWSSRHIPPFPPDDQEAAWVARNYYLKRYYRSIGQTDTPEYQKLLEESDTIRRTIRNIEDWARRMDLRRITWTNLNEETVWEWYIHDTHFNLPFRP